MRTNNNKKSFFTFLFVNNRNHHAVKGMFQSFLLGQLMLPSSSVFRVFLLELISPEDQSLLQAFLELMTNNNKKTFYFLVYAGICILKKGSSKTCFALRRFSGSHLSKLLTTSKNAAAIATDEVFIINSKR